MYEFNYVQTWLVSVGSHLLVVDNSTSVYITTSIMLSFNYYVATYIL